MTRPRERTTALTAPEPRCRGCQRIHCVVQVLLLLCNLSIGSLACQWRGMLFEVVVCGWVQIRRQPPSRCLRGFTIHTKGLMHASDNRRRPTNRE